ncbi:hypothetical protein [uncultured Eubacterium sp.]|uniref:hypothetical protein n=1 Tax=uncultured Eubacterium sp. TaxID=165185 RepID=UPI0025D3CC98|nr:hypothetical protein [uncultured Eubacterium sp.]
MEKQKESDCFGYTMTCPICGKRFWVADLRQYVYKSSRYTGYRFYCSYGCWRKDGN